MFTKEHEKSLGRDDLILPICFVTAPVLELPELLNAKFQQSPQRSNRTAKILVVQSGVTEEGFGRISHGS